MYLYQDLLGRQWKDGVLESLSSRIPSLLESSLL